MLLNRCIDAWHQGFPVRAAIQRTEENRHLRCIPLIAARERQLCQLIFKEIDIRIKFPQIIGQILR